jgi:hypothetical protein
LPTSADDPTKSVTPCPDKPRLVVGDVSGIDANLFRIGSAKVVGYRR